MKFLAYFDCLNHCRVLVSIARRAIQLFLSLSTSDADLVSMQIRPRFNDGHQITVYPELNCD